MPLPKIQMTKPSGGGCYLSFETDFGVSASIKATGSYSPEHSQIAIAAFQQTGGDGLLIDIGAHIGTFSIPVALATGCRVHAFEAQRVISQMLGANFVLSGIDNAIIEHVVLGPLDIGPEVAVRVIDYTKRGNFSAYATDPDIFHESAARKMIPTDKYETVKAMPLDAFQLENVFFIKLDVEGAELGILKGGVGTLTQNNYPPLLFEAWDKEWYAERKRELIGFIEKLGYVVADFHGDFLAQHRSRPVLSPV